VRHSFGPGGDIDELAGDETRRVLQLSHDLIMSTTEWPIYIQPARQPSPRQARVY
jgi:hypothetical protein